MNNPYHGRSVDDPYFQDRSQAPYRSTVALHSLADQVSVFERLGPGDVLLDVGCGTGSEAAFIANLHPEIRIHGVDLEKNFIDTASSRYASSANLSFGVCALQDVQRLEIWDSVRVLWLSQVLSCLPIWWDDALDYLIAPNLDSVVINTLAWPGEIESTVIHHIPDHSARPSVNIPYNVFSIDRMVAFMAERGFSVAAMDQFEIDVDLPLVDDTNLGSYTERLQDGRRFTFSLWQRLPWVLMVFARAID